MIQSGERTRAVRTSLDVAARVEVGLVAILFALYAAIVLPTLMRIGLRVPLGHNEGWNAYYAMAAATGGTLYPDQADLIVNNYPPLSFYIRGLFGRLLSGDYVLAGRLLALASLIIVAANVFLLARWARCDRLSSALASVTFLMLFTVLTPDYVGQNDPQILGLALVTSGALVFLRGEASALSMTIAAGLVVAGGLVKHNLFLLPVALCCWAAVYERRRLALFVVAGIGVGLCAGAVLYAAWGDVVFLSVLRASRVVQWQRIAAAIDTVLIQRKVLAVILVALPVLLLQFSRREIQFIAIYIACASVFGFLMTSGQGVNFNVLHDFAIALSLALAGTACFVVFPRQKAWFGKLDHPLMLPVIAALALVAGNFFVLHPDLYRPLDAEMEMTRDVVARLAMADGPVACENEVFCFWAGKPQEIDFFDYGQKLLTGSLSDTRFRNRIARHYYRLILMDARYESKLWPPRLPKATDDWLQANYVPVHTYGNVVLFAPKGASQARDR